MNDEQTSVGQTSGEARRANECWANEKRETTTDRPHGFWYEQDTRYGFETCFLVRVVLHVILLFHGPNMSILVLCLVDLLAVYTTGSVSVPLLATQIPCGNRLSYIS